MSTVMMGRCWPMQMPPTPKAVLMSLADNANDHGYCWPSLTTICERTCFGRTAVIEAIKWLETNGVLNADRSDRYRTAYTITPDAFSGSVLEREANQSARRTSSVGDGLVRETDFEVRETDDEVRQADTNRKEPSRTVNRSNRQKGARDIHVDLPEWLSPETWADWVEHRKSIRKPMTRRAAELSIGQLADLRSQGFTPKAVIENAIVSGWQGLYAPKTGGLTKAQPTSTAGNRQQQLEQRNRAVGENWTPPGVDSYA